MDERRRKMRCKWEKKSNGYREKEGKGDTSRNLAFFFFKVTYKTKGKANQELT